MTKPFLILQLRPEAKAADDEFAAFLKFGKLDSTETHRIRMEKDDLPNINVSDYSGIIIGGGPYCVSDSNKPAEQQRFEAWLHQLLDEIIASDAPLLGACYGIGIVADHLGAIVSKERYGEGVGAVSIQLTEAAANDPLTTGLPPEFRAFGGHKEACQTVPEGATLLARSSTCPVQMIRVKQNVYGVQFHSELDSAGLEVRINTYKHAGYFAPKEGADLIAAARKETISAPHQILERFIERYRTSLYFAVAPSLNQAR